MKRKESTQYIYNIRPHEEGRHNQFSFRRTRRAFCEMACKRAQSRTCSGYAECSRHYEKRPTPCGAIVIYIFILKSTLCKTVVNIINFANDFNCKRFFCGNILQLFLLLHHKSVVDSDSLRPDYWQILFFNHYY